jgi:hypothetical protein
LGGNGGPGEVKGMTATAVEPRGGIPAPFDDCSELPRPVRSGDFGCAIAAIAKHLESAHRMIGDMVLSFPPEGPAFLSAELASHSVVTALVSLAECGNDDSAWGQ